MSRNTRTKKKKMELIRVGTYWGSRGGQIGWLLEVKPHECDSSILEIHSVANRKSMHIRTNRGGVAKMRSLGNDPGKETFCYYEPRKFPKRTENIHVLESLRISL